MRSQRAYDLSDALRHGHKKSRRRCRRDWLVYLGSKTFDTTTNFTIREDRYTSLSHELGLQQCLGACSRLGVEMSGTGSGWLVSLDLADLTCTTLLCGCARCWTEVITCWVLRDRRLCCLVGSSDPRGDGGRISRLKNHEAGGRETRSKHFWSILGCIGRAPKMVFSASYLD